MIDVEMSKDMYLELVTLQIRRHQNSREKRWTWQKSPKFYRLYERLLLNGDG